MAKIVFAADLHFGVPGRTADILWACRVIREYCKAAKVDTVVILGDMFHDRCSLDIHMLVLVASFFEETATKYDQKWIVFPGNHDMFLRHSWEINSLMPLNRHLTVITDIKLVTFDDSRFWVLPFIQSEKPFMRVVKAIEKQYEEGDVLLTHIGVRGSILNTCFLLKDWSFVTFDHSKFQKIYTGHFHTKQSVNDQVHYPGSIIPFKFDEGDSPHGFYVYDLDEKAHKFINIWKAGEKLLPGEKQPPQFCTLVDELLDQKTEADIRNNIVRVMCKREYTIDEKKQIKERLVSMGAQSVRWMNLFQKLEKPPEQAFNIVQPQRHLFKTWISMDKKGMADLDQLVLNSAHDDVVLSGDEMYTAEEVDVG